MNKRIDEMTSEVDGMMKSRQGDEKGEVGDVWEDDAFCLSM